MKSLLTIVIGLLTLLTQAQSFEESIKEGDRLYGEEKYLESAKAYEQAFKIQEGNAVQYYNAACSWALSGDTVHAIKCLNQSAVKGWKNLEHIKGDTDLASLHATSSWGKVLDKMQANLDAYEKDFDSALKSQLEQIYVKDQTLRQLYQDAQQKFGSGSEEMNYFWTVISRQDSLNQLEVIDILENRGWVGKSLVGGEANMALWLVIQHAPLETQEKYLPLLKESVQKGESEGRHLARLEDRIQMGNQQPQVYGSQITRDEETGNQVVYEILEPEFVNQRRREVGLGPIEDYLKSRGIEWTIEQKVK